MDGGWPVELRGVLVLPSGRRVRGRSLRAAPSAGPAATWSVRLAARPPAAPDEAVEWIRWRDFWLPAEPENAIAVLRRMLDQAGDDRVEVACRGGVGRTGTALAALCVLDGHDPARAVGWVRSRYHPRAVEVPWQRRFLTRAAAYQEG